MHVQACDIVLQSRLRAARDDNVMNKGDLMVSAKRNSILKAVVVSLTFAAVALAFVPMAGAQAMGEYGAVVGNSAASAAAAPKAQLPAIPGASVQSGPSGTTTTEIREDDSSPADAQADDTADSQSGDDWTEVKGSDDSNQ